MPRSSNGLVEAAILSGVGVVAWALLLRPSSTPTAEQNAAEVAAGAAGNEAPRSLINPSPTTSGAVGSYGAEVAAQADSQADYSPFYGRNVGTPIDYAAGTQVKVKGGIATFVRYTAGTRSAMWSVNGRSGLIPWDTLPDMYDWRSGEPSPKDAKTGGPVVALFDVDGYFGHPGDDAIAAVRGWFSSLLPKAAPKRPEEGVGAGGGGGGGGGWS